MSHASAYASPITLDDLVALNNEVLGLVRAGVPLERTLGQLRGELPRRLARITDQLAAQTAQGQTLPQAIESAGDMFPPVYRALVEAGMRTGRLDLALASMSKTANRLGELRRNVGAALIYPLVVLFIAYDLFVFYVTRLLPQMIMVAEQHVTPVMRLLERIGQYSNYWAPIFPVLLILLGFGWWVGTHRAAVLQPTFSARLFRWVPVAGALLRNVRLATLCEVLKLLVEQQVPLPNALELAADASGDPRYARSARHAAAKLTTGGDLGQSDELLNAFPPYLRWTLLAGGRRRSMPAVLGHLADNYYDTAKHKAEWLRTVFPALVVLVVGGLTVLSYALAVFLPFVQLMYQISTSTTLGLH